MRSILAAALLLVSTSAHAITRAIMEQTAASNNTVFVDTQTIKFGVGTITPRTTFDVEGNAQFGQAPHKSTFSVDGSLHLADGATITGGSTTARGTGLDVTQSPYLAVCDGTTDDSVAIQACLNASASAGTPCLLPNRTCAFGNASTNAHVSMTFPVGSGLAGFENGSSVLLFNTDGGGGVCGQGSGGLIRATSTTGGSSDRTIKYVQLKANKKDPGCILNASTATSGQQVSNTVLEHVSFYDTANSTGTWGILLGNTVSFRVRKQSYFAPSLARHVYSIGRFFNDIHLDGNFFDSLLAGATANYQVQLSSTSGEVNGWSINDSVFEAGPNAIQVIGAAGGSIANNYFSDVVSLPSTSSWIEVNGYASKIGPNYFNSEGSNTKMTCVKLSGGYGHTVSGNMCDSADIAFDVEASTGNAVKGNDCFFPGRVCVKVSSGTGNEIGLNAELGNYTTSARFPIYCDGGSSGNKFLTTSSNVNNVNYTDLCKANNLVENVTDGSLNGYGSANFSSFFKVGPSTDTTAAFNSNNSQYLGRSSLVSGSGSAQVICKTTSTENCLSIHNGFLGANEGSKYGEIKVGTLAGLEWGVNSNNNEGAPGFRYGGGKYGDTWFANTRDASHTGGIPFYINGIPALRIDLGGITTSSAAIGSLNIPGVEVSSPTGISQLVAVTAASSVTVTGGSGTNFSLKTSSGISVGADLQVTGTLQANKVKADGTQITGMTESQIANLVTDLSVKASTGVNADITQMNSLAMIRSTMTVYHATFTVEGVDANGASIKSSGTVVANAICFGDTSHCQTTAAGAGTIGGTTSVNFDAVGTGGASIGPGNLYETSTGTSVNLPFTFNSTTTVGVPSVQTSTLSYTAVVNGGWAICASTQPSAQTMVNFVNFRSSYTYEIEYNIVNNTTGGAMQVQLNGDTGANYKWGVTNVVSGGSTGVAGGSGDTSWHLQRVTALAGDTMAGTVELRTMYGNGGNVKGIWKNAGQIDATNSDAEFGGGRYLGTSLKSLQLSVNAGTMTGWVDVWCKYVAGH